MIYQKRVKPLIKDRDNPSGIDGNLLPSGLRHIKVLKGRIAPPSIVIR